MAGSKKSATAGNGPVNAQSEETAERAADRPPSAISEESRMLAAIVYVLGIFVAVLVLLLKKEDRFVRFHAAQAILLDLVIMAASLFLFVIGFGLIAVLGIATLGIGFIVGFWVVWVLMMVLGIGVFLLRLFMAWKAFSGERPGLPFIGEHADRIAMG